MTRPATAGWMVAVGLLAAASPALAQSPVLRSNPAMLAAFREAVAKPSESTVRITADGKDAALGTVVSQDGWIITKASLLKGKLACKLKDGRKFDAEWVGAEPKTDLAMLKIQATGLKAVVWHDSKKAEVGDWVAAPSPGEAPVVVGVVGVATRKTSARDFLQDPPPAGSGYLGVFLTDAEGSPTVSGLEPAGPASKAGLKPGDKILTVHGKKMPSTEELIAAIQQFKAGAKVVLIVKRGVEEEEIQVELGKRPPNPGLNRGDMQNRMGSELSKKRSGFPQVMQHDMVIKPVDCGGPVVDLDGRALGVNIARGGRTESYAIPSELVVSLISDLKSGKLPPPKPEIDPTKVKSLEKAVDDAKKALVAAEKALEDAKKDGDRRKMREARAEVKQKQGLAAEAQKALDEYRGDATKP